MTVYWTLLMNRPRFRMLSLWQMMSYVKGLRNFRHNHGLYSLNNHTSIAYGSVALLGASSSILLNKLGLNFPCTIEAINALAEVGVVAKDIISLFTQIEPDWRQTLNLKKLVEDRITKDGAVGTCIANTAAALVAGGLVAAE